MTRDRHAWVEVDRHENDDRVRTRDECSCGATRYGCLAKRLNVDGLEAWGPVGVQTYSVEEL